MKAMTINKYGENAKFEPMEIENPVLKSGQVLIKVHASSVNTVDTMIRSMGKDLPFSPENPAILGMDVAGTIEEVGNNVTEFCVGDEIYGCVGGLADLQGTLAEYVAADSKLIAHKPKNLTMKEAAALPLVGITAYEGLKRANIKSGQKVLVHGGTGGVGHVAVQLAKHFGANVYATCGGENQMDIIKNYGAEPINYKTEQVVDYVNKHTNGVGFDIVFDSVGGENMLKSFEAATLNGQVASTVSLCELDLSTVHFKGLSLHVVFMLIPMLHNFKREQHGEILSNITKIVEAGNLKPLLDAHQFTLNNVGEAYTRLESKNAIGKVVVEN
ncbi:zinc-dependent alcohol dehydrogenase family protein [Lutibacter holmesii]|uniref:Zinc-dependent alcohol dehydrogenase family protein n=1 Tax=Lutibacter holmesii TaxID=1137985 RepID=A0ABW3WM92_9FLAO